jgi:hypothetical protein
MTVTTEFQTVCCANEDHEKAVRAVARVRWPDGRFHPTTACTACLGFIMDEHFEGGAAERHSVLIDPILSQGEPVSGYEKPRPAVVCLCGSTRFYDEFQQANYNRTMAGEIVLSVGFYPHAKAEHGHGEGVGHDSTEKAALDELHKRKIDLADYVLVVSDETGYFGESTRGEIDHAVRNGKPVEFTNPAARQRAYEFELI